MILIKKTSAWNELSKLIDRDEEREIESPFFKLYDAILESEKMDDLDVVVNSEYPAGVEADELEDFFKDEQDFILDKLGIELEPDEEDSDEDEGDDEDAEDED